MNLLDWDLADSSYLLQSISQFGYNIAHLPIQRIPSYKYQCRVSLPGLFQLRKSLPRCSYLFSRQAVSHCFLRTDQRKASDAGLNASISFLNFFIWERERERASEQERGRGTERGNPKQSPCWAWSPILRAQSMTTRSWPELKSRVGRSTDSATQTPQYFYFSYELESQINVYSCPWRKQLSKLKKKKN